MTRDVMTARLYGGEEGWTLYPKNTYHRPNVHMEKSPLHHVRDVVMGAWLLFVLWCIVVVAWA